jgi:hypothetical protein
MIRSESVALADRSKTKESTDHNMSAINHELDPEHLHTSTALSRAMSLARSEMELGNVALESARLTELDARTRRTVVTYVRKAKKHLRKSMLHLRSMIDEIDALLDQIRNQGGMVVPETVDLRHLGQRFCTAGLVHRESWTFLRELMLNGAPLHDLLIFFRMNVRIIYDFTGDLFLKFDNLAASAGGGKLNEVFQHNQTKNNIKFEFARLFRSWNDFQSLFLASSVMSTELTYRRHRRGSLLTEDPVPLKARAAA